MKILLYSFDFHPCAGGVNTFLYGHLEGLRSRGHEVDFLHSGHIKFLPNEKKEKIKRYEDSIANLFPDLPGAVRNIEILKFAHEQLVSSIDLNVYELIHSNNGVTSQVIKSASARVPLFGTVHGNYYKESIFNKTVSSEQEADWMKVYDRYAVECPDLVHTVSLAMLEGLPAIPNDKHRVIHNSINLDQFQPTFKTSTPLKIAGAGILNSRKGYDLLLKAVEYFHTNRYPEFAVTIFGDGPMRKELELEVKEKNLPVSMPGYITPVQLREALPSFDIFIHPSRYEPFGLAVTEAMASGCSIICSDSGGLTEQIKHEYNGLIFSVDQLEELKTCMERLLVDDVLRERLRHQAVRYVEEHFSTSVILDQFEKAYKELVGKTI